MSVFQLVYLSHANDNFLSDSEFNCDEILHTANTNNKELNITGILLYRNGIFLQLLEGDKDTILNLFGRITADSRHKSIDVLVKQSSPERIFKSWSMAFSKINDESYEDIKKNINWDGIIKKRNNYEDVSNEKLMEIFRNFKYKLKD